ncbi:MAG: YaeQ family protein [Pseudomonadales bacterium]|nr:YaeQ family protein [Pseudomonadales bacterium]
MALKPTIFKCNISVSDLNRDYYDTLQITVAQHPSETLERMMARVLAYCINADEYLVFTKGLSSVDEPDIWLKSLDGQLSLWIDMGEPDPERIKKATRLAREVRVYSFNSKSDVWWSQGKGKFAALEASFFQFQWKEIQALAALVTRTMDMSVTITGDSAYIAMESGECEVSWTELQPE